MDWRQNMGTGKENEHFNSYPQYPHNPQYSNNQQEKGSFTDITDITDKSRKVKNMGVDFEAGVDSTVAELNDVWKRSRYTMEDIPPENRKRAGELDQQMTRCANAGDVPGFREALHQWKVCWIPKS